MNTINWGSINNTIGYGEQGDEYVRRMEVDTDIRYTEEGEMRVTEGIDPSGFAEVYNRSWSGETQLER